MLLLDYTCTVFALRAFSGGVLWLSGLGCTSLEMFTIQSLIYDTDFLEFFKTQKDKVK